MLPQIPCCQRLREEETPGFCQPPTVGNLESPDFRISQASWYEIFVGLGTLLSSPLPSQASRRTSCVHLIFTNVAGGDRAAPVQDAFTLKLFECTEGARAGETWGHWGLLLPAPLLDPSFEGHLPGFVSQSLFWVC